MQNTWPNDWPETQKVQTQWTQPGHRAWTGSQPDLAPKRRQTVSPLHTKPTGNCCFKLHFLTSRHTKISGTHASHELHRHARTLKTLQCAITAAWFVVKDLKLCKNKLMPLGSYHEHTFVSRKFYFVSSQWCTTAPILHIVNIVSVYCISHLSIHTRYWTFYILLVFHIWLFIY